MRIDLNKRTADILITKEEFDKRRADAAEATGGYKFPEHQTPWQEIQRGMVDELSDGMVLKPAVKYQKIAATKGVPARQSLINCTVQSCGLASLTAALVCRQTAERKFTDQPIVFICESTVVRPRRFRWVRFTNEGWEDAWIFFGPIRRSC